MDNQQEDKMIKSVQFVTAWCNQRQQTGIKVNYVKESIYIG